MSLLVNVIEESSLRSRRLEGESNRDALPLTEDQQDINEYFASAAYRESRGNLQQDPARNFVFGDWVVESSPWFESRFLPLLSFVAGLAGLNVILLALAVLTPAILLSMDDSIAPSDGFVWMMLFIQTLAFPPLIAFSVATVTPMFWYGSVLLRFFAGIVLVVPGCAGFYFVLTLIEGSPPSDFLFQFSAVMFTQFLVAGVVALIVQMWSPWSLSHARADQKPLPPLGMRAMLELTCVAAIGCSLFIIDGLQPVMEGILFFAGMGLFSSLAVMATLIAFLRESRRNLLSGVVACLAAFTMAMLMCGFFAVSEFGWNVIGNDTLYIVGTSAYGTVLMLAVMWTCLAWLRLCGWSCVNRNAVKRAKKAVA